jgi:hypothetical protein
MIRVVFDNDIVPYTIHVARYNHGDCDCLHLKEDGTFSQTKIQIGSWNLSDGS